MQHSLWSHGSVISGWQPYSIDYSCRTIIHHVITHQDTQNWFGEQFFLMNHVAITLWDVMEKLICMQDPASDSSRES